MRRRIDGTDIEVSQLCLGGNIFGWTADEQESFAVLDDFAAAGGNFIDTADVYSSWAEGHSGGESETVIGNWITARGNRAQVVLATKVGAAGGLGEANIRERFEASLERLGTDYIDLYYCHRDDLETPLEETLETLDELVRAGRVRQIAASNYKAERLAEAVAVSERNGYARFVALSPHYNLLERDYERTLAEVCQRHDIACMPYYGLAKGFLTGKYRPGAGDVSRRGPIDGSRYVDERGLRVLDELEAIALAHETSVAAVALGWLAAQPTVVSPIASARTPEQLSELLAMEDVRLTVDELQRLDEVSEARA